jgi:hypothetical protein
MLSRSLPAWFNAGHQPLVEEPSLERRIGADTFEKFSHAVRRLHEVIPVDEGSSRACSSRPASNCSIPEREADDL